MPEKGEAWPMHKRLGYPAQDTYRNANNEVVLVPGSNREKTEFLVIDFCCDNPSY